MGDCRLSCFVSLQFRFFWVHVWEFTVYISITSTSPRAQYVDFPPQLTFSCDTYSFLYCVSRPLFYCFCKAEDGIFRGAGPSSARLRG